MTSKVEKGNVLYLSVVGGNMVESSKEGVKGAVKREYETSDGKKGVKYEILHKNLVGRITEVEFKDGSFGEQALIKFQNGKEKAIVTVTTSSKYFTDFAKKLPNVDLSKDVTFNVYDFESKEGKQQTGVSITQEGVKVKGAYWDSETKKSLKGFPNVSKSERADMDSDDWKMFFIKVKKFLKKEVLGITFPTYEYTDDSGSAGVDEGQDSSEGLGQEEEDDDLPF